MHWMVHPPLRAQEFDKYLEMEGGREREDGNSTGASVNAPAEKPTPTHTRTGFAFRPNVRREKFGIYSFGVQYKKE